MFLQGFPVWFLSHPFTPSLICVPCNVIGVTWHARWSVPFDLLHRSIWLRTHLSIRKEQAQIVNLTGLVLRLSHKSRDLFTLDEDSLAKSQCWSLAAVRSRDLKASGER